MGLSVNFIYLYQNTQSDDISDSVLLIRMKLHARRLKSEYIFLVNQKIETKIRECAENHEYGQEVK